MGALKRTPQSESLLPQVENSNCFLGFAYLLIRGCVNEVVFVTLHKEKFWHIIPCHVISLNRNGHAIHFCRSQDGQSKFWFHGRMTGISRKGLSQALQDSGRQVIGRSRSRMLMWTFTALFMLVLLPVWTVWWVTHPYIWLLGSTFEAVVKRK